MKSFLFVSLLTICAYPQSAFRFEHLTLTDGASSNTTNSILQDRKGFLWFGTEDGLNRYDGYNFKVYQRKNGVNSLSQNFIWSLAEDTVGHIWIGTDNGLNKFNPAAETFTIFKHDPENKHSVSSNNIQCVYVDRRNTVWVGTWGEGLNKYNPSDNTYSRFTHHKDVPGSITNNKIFSIYEDSRNNFWIGTDGGGLNILNRETGTFNSFIHKPGDQNSISGNSVLTIFEDSGGYIWIGTYGKGLSRFNPRTNSFKSFNLKGSPLYNEFVWKIAEDRQGFIWIATMSNGLVIITPGSEEFISIKNDPDNSSSLSSDFIKTLYEDRSGVMWIGTLSGGINKIDRKKPKFLSLQKQKDPRGGLNEDFVFTICEDNAGDIWIGTYGSGITKFSPSSNAFSYYKVDAKTGKGIDGEIIRYIFKDSKGDIWIGTYFGKLNKYDRKSDSFIKINLDPENKNSGLNNVRIIFEDRDGMLWFGTNGGGLIRYDQAKDEYYHFFADSQEKGKLSGNEVLSITEDNLGNLWVGTYGTGLNKLNKKTFEFTHYLPDDNNPFSISDNIIPELFCGSDGNIWAGTYSGGLCRYDIENDGFTVYSRDDGLTSNNIGSILEDDRQNLWISTATGITKFNLKENSFSGFDQNNGLRVGEFNPSAKYKTKDGWLYFGGVNGVNYFHPDSITTNDFVPPVYITSFKLFSSEFNPGKNIAYTDSVILKHYDSNFSIEFASLDYTQPGKNKYEYMLEGVDKNWVASGTRNFANYTHLNPGKYIFRLKGTNNDGLWNNAGSELFIIIEPPFWGTWWFRSIGFIVIAGAVGFIYKRRVSNLEKDKASQEEFSKQLINSQENERKRIASELHDSLGQELLIIKNRALMALKKNDKGFLIKQLEDISAAASSGIEEVRQIAYNLHPYQLDRLGLTKAISSIMNQAEVITKTKFRTSIDDIDDIFSKENEINVYRIVQECVSNIVKHSEADTASITINKANGFVRMKISDNGRGCAPNIIEGESNGFGMKSLSKRIELLEGDFKINTVPDKGMNILISIPVHKNE